MYVNVYDRPIALPGQCWGCGGAEKKFYIDIGLQVEFYGAFYLCNECFHSIAFKLDYLSPPESINKAQLISELRDQNEQLRARLEYLTHALDVLTSVGVQSGGSHNPVHIGPDDFSFKQPNVAKDSTLVQRVPSERFKQLELGEGKTSESGNDEGMAVVRTIKSKSDNEFRFSL